MNIFQKLQKRGYQITNKRVLGNPQYTSEQTRRKDLIQELALVNYWLLDNHQIWIEPQFEMVIGETTKFVWNFIINTSITIEEWNQDCYIYPDKKFNSPLEATIAAIEFLIENKLI